ncbi:hypothetical protein bcgnr5394_44420 [Bacillus cereus]|nr:hypothetical protein [Bacillus cereus]BCC56846.1 hypothetical protein BCJMU10_0154 [Bacillus cereus]GMB73754.1 hypothetical protein BCER1_01550 [Bacillus cereus]
MFFFDTKTPLLYTNLQIYFKAITIYWFGIKFDKNEVTNLYLTTKKFILKKRLIKIESLFLTKYEIFIKKF